jgi:signal transduction histidine kinase
MKIISILKTHRLFLVGLLAILPYLVFVVSLIIFRLDFVSKLDQMAIRLKANWEIRWGDSPRNADGEPEWILQEDGWQSLVWPRMFIDKEADFAWMRTPLSERHFTSPVLIIWGAMQEFECYLDQKLIYQSQNLDSLQQAIRAGGSVNKHNFSKWHIFPLPSDYQNKLLYIRIYSNHSDRIGLLYNSIFLGSALDYYRYFFVKDIPLLGPAYLFFVLGFLSLFTFLIRIRQRPYQILTFGFTMFTAGVAFLLSAKVIQIIFNTPVVLYYALPAFMYLMPVTLFAFFETIIPRHKGIFRVIWIFFLLFAILALSLEVLFDTNPFMLVQIFSILYLLCFVLTTIIVIGGAKRHGGEVRIFAFGTIALFLTGIHELLMYLKIVPGENEVNTFQFGMAVFVLSLFYILERRYAKNQEDLELYSKELEDKTNKLEEYGRTLEQKVSERTQELKNKNDQLENTLKKLQETQFQLVQSEKMASLGNLVAGVAHEINNPTGAVNSAADTSKRLIRQLDSLLENDKELAKIMQEDKFQKKYNMLKENNYLIQMAGKKIAEIVKSLKNFARLDEADQQDADIHEGIENTLLLVQHELKNRIVVHKEYGEIPKIWCYPNQLNQVFMNLFVNAAHAMPDKGELTIKTSKQDHHITIEISDTGSGIPEKNLERVFDPGFTTKGVGVGTGLGLSIVYNIIKKHKGDITVSSEPGKGTTFTIKLPMQ